MSSDVDQLRGSLDSYHRRLAKIMESIPTAGPDEKTYLMSLMEDLVELIAITEHQLSDILPSGSTDDPIVVESDSSDECVELPGSGEFSGFPNELETSSTETYTALQEMEKVFAPYRHDNGSVEYYAAFCIDNNSEDDTRVFYLTPMSDKMRPCLDLPHCTRYKCKFSHGTSFKRSQLRPYEHCSVDRIKPQERVIVKDSDSSLWTNGTIVQVLNEDHIRVALELSGAILDVRHQEVMPRCPIEKETIGLERGVDSVLPCVNDDLCVVSRTTRVDDRFGGWETHTKGFGSRIMEKMGYVRGQGLGKQREGRVAPVEATILPSGASLDHVMTLKQSKKLRKVGDKSLKRNPTKPETVSPDTKCKPEFPSDVFDFLNSNIGHRKAPTKRKAPGNCEPDQSTAKKSTNLCVNTTISQVNKNLATKTEFELNTLLLQKQKLFATLTSRLKSLKKKQEIHPHAMEKEVRELTIQVSTVNVELATINSLTEKKKIKRQMNF